MGTIVGFYTKDTFYEEEAQRLLKSIDQFGLSSELKTIEDQGTWLKNTGLKASILLEFRKKIRGPILYLDVDAYLHKDPWPYFKNLDLDIGCYITDNGELLSGTIYLADSEKVIDLLELWSSLCQKNPEVWDQKLLHEAIKQSPDLNFKELSHSLCYIFDSKSKLAEKDIIIEHLQASREIKKVKRWTGFFNSSFYRRRKRLKAIDSIK